MLASWRDISFFSSSDSTRTTVCGFASQVTLVMNCCRMTISGTLDTTGAALLICKYIFIP